MLCVLQTRYEVQAAQQQQFDFRVRRRQNLLALRKHAGPVRAGGTDGGSEQARGREEASEGPEALARFGRHWPTERDLHRIEMAIMAERYTLTGCPLWAHR
jgi:hypothetical protein